MAGGFPVFVEEASGARLADVDGNEYVDLCLGDTGAMTGHALPQALFSPSHSVADVDRHTEMFADAVAALVRAAA